jgi:type IV pilus assembly protein PilQ
MKTKLAMLLAAGMSICVAFAQTDPAKAAGATPTNAPPATVTAPPTTAEPTNNAAPAPAAAVEPITLLPQAKPSDAPVDLAPKIPRTATQDAGPLSLEHELPIAIQFLARMANLNIYIDPSITFTNLGTVAADGRVIPPVVSLRWENVRAEDALDEVLDIYGMVLVPNPKTGVARVIKKPTEPPRFTTVVQLQYSNPTNIADLVKTTFADPLKSRVNADARTSQLLIVATAKEIEAITNLVALLDTPTRQVLIEARLLETAKNPRTIKGVDWSGTLEAQNVTFGNGRTTGTAVTQTPGAPVTTTLPSGRTVTTPGASSTRTELTTQLGLGGMSLDTARGFYPQTAFLNADGVRAVLSFLNSDADTEVVATPRQVTSDNQTATLAVTRAFPIFETTPGTAQTPPSAKITYTNLGTILKVTPRITANSNIALRVIPEVSNVDSKDRQIINGDINEANVYAIRRMETDVMIPNGHTLVMGGLISDTSTKNYTKVPILGDVPGFGLLFRRDSKERRKSNLIIFITPTIVQSGDFQPTPSDFLQNKPKDKPDIEESAWDRGKPHRFKKSPE